ncbi:DUF397 domain-containing protein [Nocardiopsis sp. MG754419]|uniref:DUF397 domain-containing protein n=1 Tax=Nocardiopsis sp. MG754419 TaxID=2259865 RepID=UPI0027DD0CEC|nr:DUF397 domain-containing protein [Nocardiopsis sp. MG754419]
MTKAPTGAGRGLRIALPDAIPRSLYRSNTGGDRFPVSSHNSGVYGAVLNHTLLDGPSAPSRGVSTFPTDASARGNGAHVNFSSIAPPNRHKSSYSGRGDGCVEFADTPGVSAARDTQHRESGYPAPVPGVGGAAPDHTHPPLGPVV